MSKIIDKNNALIRSNWQSPIVEELTEGADNKDGKRSLGTLTEEKIEVIKKRAYKDGYMNGFKKGSVEGNAAGLQQAAQTLNMLETILETLTEPLKQLDEQVEQQFVRLVMIITNQLVRRELKIDPGEVVGVVREALQALPVASRSVRVFLCPEDISFVSSVLNASDSETAWKIVSDPSLTRGDCRIESESASIDATVERRLITIILDMLGGERGTDEILTMAADD